MAASTEPQAQTEFPATPGSCTERIKRCEALVNEANSALRDELKVNLATRTELENLNAALTLEDAKLAADTVALDSWYHNPVVVGVLGILVGGAGYALLQHR